MSQQVQVQREYSEKKISTIDRIVKALEQVSRHRRHPALEGPLGAADGREEGPPRKRGDRGRQEQAREARAEEGRNQERRRAPRAPHRAERAPLLEPRPVQALPPAREEPGQPRPRGRATSRRTTSWCQPATPVNRPVRCSASSGRPESRPRSSRGASGS